MMAGGDVEPLIGAPCGISDEVREGFMEGLNRVICVFMKEKEGVE